MTTGELIEKLKKSRWSVDKWSGCGDSKCYVKRVEVGDYEKCAYADVTIRKITLEPEDAKLCDEDNPVSVEVEIDIVTSDFELYVKKGFVGKVGSERRLLTESYYSLWTMLTGSAIDAIGKVEMLLEAKDNA